jgi:hypothetical protein
MYFTNVSATASQPSLMPSSVLAINKLNRDLSRGYAKRLREAPEAQSDPAPEPPVPSSSAIALGSEEPLTHDPFTPPDITITDHSVYVNDYLQPWAAANHFALVVSRSNLTGLGSRYVDLRCILGDKRRPPRGTTGRASKSIKLCCPVELKISYREYGPHSELAPRPKRWELRSQSTSTHNHPPIQPSDLPSVRRSSVTPECLAFIMQSFASGTTPKNIRYELAEKFPDVMLTRQDLGNMKHKWKMEMEAQRIAAEIAPELLGGSG